MNTVLNERWTVDRFLAWEDQQEGKYEFDGERIIEMTGGSYAHQRIVLNICFLLLRLLDPARFTPVQEMRTRLPGQVRYPDVIVHPGRILRKTRTLDTAVALFEVASDDTAHIDQTDKRRAYATLPGVTSYALVEQDSPGLTLLTRPGPGANWAERTFTTGDVPFPDLGIALPLHDLYVGLEL